MLSLLVFLLLSSPASDPVRELAGKLLAALAPGETVTLTVRNVSAVGPDEVAAVGRELETLLRAGKIALAADAPAAVTVTLSENPQGPIWIAEIRRGDKRDVVMTTPALEPERRAKTPATIERELLLEQAEPMLDVIEAGDALIVLEPGEVVAYRRRENRWERQSAAPLPDRVWPRDLRGRLALDDDSLQAFLPGLACTGKWLPEVTLACSASDGPWPGGAPLARARNYFEADKLAPFYSAARAPEYTLLAGVDGRVRLLDGALGAPSSFAGWGSDLAAVQTACGDRVLATRAGEAGETDFVQGFEIAGREAAAITPALEFSGPVTALWAGQSAAIAISRDLKTGQYAAYRLTITCSR